MAEALTGCLLGMAVGDALGLPYEGLSPNRARLLLGKPDRYQFFWGLGMISDDTEHAILVSQALIASGAVPERFSQVLADRLRRWFLLLPAGIGRATALACLKLLLGYSPENSGCESAGNGAAMRAPLLGAFLSGAFAEPARLRQLNRISSRMTHRDPRAEWASLAIAVAAQLACENREISAREFLNRLEEHLRTEPAHEFLSVIRQMIDSVETGQTVSQYQAQQGLSHGVSGYVMHSIPVVLHCWLLHQNDYTQAVTTAIQCGGDADTNAALVGGIVGARVGIAGIPDDWLAGLSLWPDTLNTLKGLAGQLAEVRQSGIPERFSEPSEGLVLLRNLFFLGVVLLHGFRRLLPPY